MKYLLICPAERPALSGLSENTPLVLLPALGKAFIEHWLEELATLGAKNVLILAADRPAEIRNFVGEGARWGMRVEVVPETRELTVEEARAKYQSPSDTAWLPSPGEVIYADHFPQLPKSPAFESYAGWLRVLTMLLEGGTFPNYIGLHEVRPNIWVGRRAHIAKSAVLERPCWIGANAWIGERAHIGPLSIVEDGAFVDSGAVVHASVIMPTTYLGRGTELRQSIACKNTLINWGTNAQAKVPERVLLSGLDTPHPVQRCEVLLARLMALLVLAITLPFATCIALRSWIVGQSAFRIRKAVRPNTATSAKGSRSVLYYELLNTGSIWQRWPQLWNVFQGDFAWVGNRPLTGIQAGRLTTDFDRLWLDAPTGLFSLADAEDCIDTIDEEARAHSSFYAVQSTRSLKISILRRVIGAVLFAAPTEQDGAVPLSEPVIKHSEL
jgi:acetyltransferase-like isoleucine patch superfamily enzyme